jgi:dTDP-glucose 4,6-dehydratase
MNVLVTGGAGFIGSTLVRYLLGDGEADREWSPSKLVNLDLLTYAGNLHNLEAVIGDPRHVFVRGDIREAPLISQLLREHRIDRVIHLAAESHVDRSIEGPEAFASTNVLGTLTLLEAFRSYVGKPGRRCGDAAFVHVSTDEVFGSLGPNDPPFTEASPYSPNSPYSASKAGADHMVRAYFHTYGLPVVTTYCTNNYGPNQFPEKLIPLMISKAIRGEPLPVYGDGRNRRDWLHVNDHCRGLAMALSNGTAGESYAFAGGCEMSNIDVVAAVLDALRALAPELGHRSLEEAVQWVEDRPGHDRRYAIDSSKARHRLGWEPRISFTDGIRRTVRWYLENRQWLEQVEPGSNRGQRLGIPR